MITLPTVQLQRLDSTNDSRLYQRRRTMLMLEDGPDGEGACGGSLQDCWHSQLGDHRPVGGASSAVDLVGGGGGGGGGVTRGCGHCGEGFGPTERAWKSGGQAWHERCLLCAQCFQPFRDGIFYEFDGRKFCEHDFTILFKPCCAKCGTYIVGRVIRALQASWHPACFGCQLCGRVLTDAFVKSLGRALCRDCGAEERLRASAPRYQCNRCKDTIEKGQLLRHRGDNYHAYHYNCVGCKAELTGEAREKEDQLYCVRCFDRLGMPVCARCRRPIDQERVVHAGGRTWHVEHFVCAACEKPFNGTRHFERGGLAYCAVHYQRLFGQVCFLCGDTISDGCVETCAKSWCREHFRCSACDRVMHQRSTFYEYDLKPVCKHCYQRFPKELRKRLAKIHKQSR